MSHSIDVSVTKWVLRAFHHLASCACYFGHKIRFITVMLQSCLSYTPLESISKIGTIRRHKQWWNWAEGKHLCCLFRNPVTNRDQVQTFCYFEINFSTRPYLIQPHFRVSVGMWTALLLLCVRYTVIWSMSILAEDLLPLMMTIKHLKVQPRFQIRLSGSHF